MNTPPDKKTERKQKEKMRREWIIITLLMLAAAVGATGANQETEAAVQMVRTEIASCRSWVQLLLNSTRVGPAAENDVVVGVADEALGDCAKLYEETESMLEPLLVSSSRASPVDAVTWLSAALANHRSCVDGLNERSSSGFDFDLDHHHHHKALTSSIRNALALYAHRKLEVDNVTLAGNKSDYLTNGLLMSWTTSSGSKADFVVAKDGSGTHVSINDAVGAAAAGRKSRDRERVVIYVKAGVYNERVEIPRHLNNLMMVGDGIDRTVVTGSRSVPDGSTTYNSATFGVSGDGFWARDITFENTAGPHKHQAVALRVSSDHSVFYRCSFKAYQDTLFVHSLRQFYRDCQIHGTVDFIFGDAAAVLQNCDIFLRRPLRGQANFVTAQGREDPNQNTGISIQGSRVRPAPELVGSWVPSYLGRPWKEYSRTVVWKTDLDGVIDPKGWKEWRGGFGLSTLYYAEYRNSGGGASTRGRVRWPGFHVLTRDEQVWEFSVGRFIQGDGWIPASGVPVLLGVE